MKAHQLLSCLLLLCLVVPTAAQETKRRGLLSGLFKPRKKKRVHESYSYHQRMEQQEYASSLNRSIKKPLHITLKEEKEIGQKLVAQFMHRHGVKLKSFKTHGAIWDYCNVLCHSLLPKMPQRLGRSWSVGILASEKPLIFSAPGGYILLSIGLLRQLRNEAELAGLLAYEMGTICRRHHLLLRYKTMVKRKQKKTFLSFLAAQQTKQTTNSKLLANMFKEAQNNLSDADKAVLDGDYIPSYIYEADTFAIRALAYHGYSPLAYASAVTKLFPKGPRKKSRPSPQNRINRIMKQVHRCFPWDKKLAFDRERYLNEVIEKLD